MITGILLFVALGILAIASFLFVKWSIDFMKLIKERDGYYLIRGVI